MCPDNLHIKGRLAQLCWCRFTDSLHFFRSLTHHLLLHRIVFNTHVMSSPRPVSWRCFVGSLHPPQLFPLSACLPHTSVTQSSPPLSSFTSAPHLMLPFLSHRMSWPRLASWFATTASQSSATLFASAWASRSRQRRSWPRLGLCCDCNQCTWEICCDWDECM